MLSLSALEEEPRKAVFFFFFFRETPTVEKKVERGKWLQGGASAEPPFLPRHLRSPSQLPQAQLLRLQLGASRRQRSKREAEILGGDEAKGGVSGFGATVLSSSPNTSVISCLGQCPGSMALLFFPQGLQTPTLQLL